MEFIKYDTDQKVACITLDRPEKRNALNEKVISELIKAFEMAATNDQIKVVILQANGPAFCAGADLEYVKSLQKNSFEDNLKDSSHLRDLFLKIHTLEKVVIAKIQGHAIAGGAGLASVCDFSFAVPQAKFGYTEVKIGFLAALVMVFLIRKIGEVKARELLLTGDLIEAREAVEIGLINKLVPMKSLDHEVLVFSQKLINENSGKSMALTKKMIAEVQSRTLEDALQYAAEMNARARETDDCKKGIQAFLDKTRVAW